MSSVGRALGQPLGRRAERERLDDVVALVAEGRSSTLVIRGEAGIGNGLPRRAWRRERAGAAGKRRRAGDGAALRQLHQLYMPILDRVELLPGPQRDAIAGAFGVRGQAAAYRLMVALAGLNLLSGAAQDRALFCEVDDAQWLEQASRQSLLFIARRLLAEPVWLVLAIRGNSVSS